MSNMPAWPTIRLSRSRARASPRCAALEAREGAPLRLIETHVSWVLLGRELAYKIKKPVRLPFLDFTSLAERRRCCDEELRLNRRFAPDLYLDVVEMRAGPDGPSLRRQRAPWSTSPCACGAFPTARSGASGSLPARSPPPTSTRSRDGWPRSTQTLPRHRPTRSSDRRRRMRSSRVARSRRSTRGCAAARSRTRVAGALRAWLDERARAARAALAAAPAARQAFASAMAICTSATWFSWRGCRWLRRARVRPGLRWIDPLDDVAFLAWTCSHTAGATSRFACSMATSRPAATTMACRRCASSSSSRALVRAQVGALREARGIERMADARRSSYLRAGRLARARAPMRGWRSRTDCPVGQDLRFADSCSRRPARSASAPTSSASACSASAPLEPSRGRVRDGIYGADATRSDLCAPARRSRRRRSPAGWPTIVDAAFLRSAERAQLRGAGGARPAPFAILDCRAEPPLLRERIAARQRARRRRFRGRPRRPRSPRPLAEPLDARRARATPSTATPSAPPDLQLWPAVGGPAMTPRERPERTARRAPGSRATGRIGCRRRRGRRSCRRCCRSPASRWSCCSSPARCSTPCSATRSMRSSWALSIVGVAGISVYQELRTQRVLEALRDLASPRSTVVRDGTRARASPARSWSRAIA